jgi:tetratricopeptide (TPR) repeat protein
MEIHFRLADTVDPRRGAATALADGKSTGWRPIIAESELRAADLIDETGDHDAAMRAYREAARDDLAAGDDEDAAFALMSIADLYARDGDAATAEPVLELARAESRRIGDPPQLLGRWLRTDAIRARAAGQPAQEVEDGRQELDGELHAWHGNASQIASARSNYAISLEEAGRIDDASREIATALKDSEALFGPQHPRIALVLEKVAIIDEAAGRLDDGLVHGQRAVAILEAWYGPNDARLIRALQYVGRIQLHTDPPAARATLEREIALENATGASPADRARSEGNLAVLEASQGNDEPALAHAKKAIAEIEAGVGPDNQELLPALDVAGTASRHLGNIDDAEAYGRRAMAIADRTMGATSVHAIEFHVGLAYTLMDEDKAKEALAEMAPIEEAIKRGHDLSPDLIAIAQLVLAQAYWQVGDHTRGHALAVAARDGFAALGPHYAAQHDQVAGWVARH